ncbi:MAG: DegT/DnrJ/EryC1/StrS family aminotransferase [Deferribacteres bacterium]|nr:DegT/DnrJ/EryC1/StrS family aminotransferase [Deferribacteres bacterium]
MTMLKNADFYQPDPALRQRIIDALQGLIDDDAHKARAAVASFERDLTVWLQCAFCRSMAHITEAAYLALRALEISAGDEVITSPFARPATLSAICRTGAKIRFVDINPLTLNLDVGHLERALSHRAKAVMPVHSFGQPAALGYLLKFAIQHELFLVEDVSDALGADYQGKSVGSFGDIAFFSFERNLGFDYRTTCCAVVANNERMKRRIIDLVGTNGSGSHPVFANAAHADPLQVAVLSVLLPEILKMRKAQQAVAGMYHTAFQDNPAVWAQAETEGVSCNYNYYFIQVQDRERLAMRLREKGVPTVPFTDNLPHQQATFKSFLATHSSLPEAESAAEKLLGLPVSPNMSKTTVEQIVELVQAHIAKGAAMDQKD